MTTVLETAIRRQRASLASSNETARARLDKAKRERRKLKRQADRRKALAAEYWREGASRTKAGRKIRRRYWDAERANEQLKDDLSVRDRERAIYSRELEIEAIDAVLPWFQWGNEALDTLTDEVKSDAHRLVKGLVDSAKGAIGMRRLELEIAATLFGRAAARDDGRVSRAKREHKALADEAKPLLNALCPDDDDA